MLRRLACLGSLALLTGCQIIAGLGGAETVGRGTGGGSGSGGGGPAAWAKAIATGRSVPCTNMPCPTQTCAVMVSGGVKCWGDNTDGQLGNGTKASSSTPVDVSGNLTAQTVSVGNSYACALATGGNVACWGHGGEGELGDGTTNSSVVPVAVMSATLATSLSAGALHACITTMEGQPMCWGSNINGDLGIGTTTTPSFTTPVTIKTLTASATAISAGAYHTCALLPVSAGGNVVCWGDDIEGQLGNGQSGTSFPSPGSVSGPTNAIGISAGYNHTCALRMGGSVVCWGFNGDGELADGSTSNSEVPVPAGNSELPPATAISAGDFHTCVLSTDAQVWCWGLNDHGQLGSGSATTHGPVQVPGLPAVKAVSAGAHYTCALTTTGHVFCWGANAFGQLGDGSTTDSTSPVQVTED